MIDDLIVFLRNKSEELLDEYRHGIRSMDVSLEDVCELLESIANALVRMKESK